MEVSGLRYVIVERVRVTCVGETSIGEGVGVCGLSV